jgi:AcrR family transcriptional regulator
MVTKNRRRPAPSSSVVGRIRTAISNGETRRDEILDTASRLFASSGLRTSLHEIADACGILPGSLYHHFESKEAIVVELVRRYQTELDRIAEIALRELKTSDPELVSDRIVGLGTAVARCAVHHSAAVQFTFYEPPADAGRELVRLANRAPSRLEAAMRETLAAGRSSGFIRPGIDLDTLADRMCQTMLHVGLGFFHGYSGVDRVASLLCEILLYGVATSPPRNSDLEGSSAFAAVEQVIQMWDDKSQGAEDERSALIRSAARAEFGRRGYEVTTIRDIASAAGLSTGSVYRIIGSKEELLASIMLSFSKKVRAGWSAALGSDSTIVEKLDAIAWLQINVVDQFNDEFKIELAWLRQSPPDTPDLGWSFPSLLREIKAELSRGVRSGEIHIESPSTELTARCVIELSWIPENIVRSLGTRRALTHARETLIRGAAASSAA